jgi:hypothetical protein
MGSDAAAPGDPTRRCSGAPGSAEPGRTPDDRASTGRLPLCSLTSRHLSDGRSEGQQNHAALGPALGSSGQLLHEGHVLTGARASRGSLVFRGIYGRLAEPDYMQFSDWVARVSRHGAARTAMHAVASDSGMPDARVSACVEWVGSASTGPASPGGVAVATAGSRRDDLGAAHSSLLVGNVTRRCAG